MSRIFEYCKDLDEKSYEQDQILMKDGNRSNRIYILIQGEVVIEKNGVILNTVSEPGAIFGEMSILLDMPHMANVRTKSPSRFFVAVNGIEFLKSDVEISYFMSQLLAKRLNGVTTYLVDMKKQYEDFEDHHFSVVDKVLGNLIHNQDDESELGSERITDDIK